MCSTPQGDADKTVKKSQTQFCPQRADDLDGERWASSKHQDMVLWEAGGRLGGPAG